MPRFYLGLTEDDKEIWRANNAVAEGNFVVTVELSFSGQDARPLDRYKAAMVAIGKQAAKRRQLTTYSWLFALDARLNDVFQILADNLGAEHHNYSAVELKTGEGLSYDAEKRMVCEFYARNWIA